MTWMAQLLKTYEANQGQVGIFEKKRNDREYALIPVAHTTQSAHITVVLDMDGHWLTAQVVDKADSNTIIPCTEASSSRTSAPVPHPLFDKLMYVAGDYIRYCGDVKGTPYADYMKQLGEWCGSSYAHPKVKSVYTYLAKGTLITDLIRAGILWADKQGQLLAKWSSEMETAHGEKPEIFKVIASDQSAAFVRFAVQAPGEPETRLWRDPSVQQSFIDYSQSRLGSSDLCFVTGKVLPYADKHTSRIRNSGDKTKLISANDTAGFTYRGRFKNSREAASISYEASQKAHNALKWLIERQGFTMDGKVFLIWGTEKLEVPDPYAGSFTLFDEEDLEADGGDGTHQAYADMIRKGLAGYRYDSDYKSNVIILILDAATPGRLSIVYYRDMNKELFLDRIQRWHETCSWEHRYYQEAEKTYGTYIGAPATKDIAYAAYGSRASDKLVKSLLERMLPCIVDERPVPLDLVRSVVQRASHPVGMENWEWERTLSIACALVRKHEKEEYEVALDTKNEDRSYLFGRLLAIADVLERRALGDEKRATNALRYMNAFARHPGRTWSIIQSNLQPYQARMGVRDLIVNHCNHELDIVMDRLRPEDYNDSPLSGLYLLGFSSQRRDLYTSKKDAADHKTDSIQEEENE
ncbi:type I-C CRISPR-associated protein Cas8c/Csd1 [Paenibacillus spiritus]|uniref:Type I-C CRISPR-associated protein Cas8c/Csd1 n=1 Tax=Paenibacillus spiritus TaxID=2496557 RepID=A0A5J5GAG4_9BACL|nr:type I-C CRISPR-associated protein Cas8c/Csd1 [Paenibacillus spiritus]KAA9004893.1 type I-C CRISPR-associated protein Cas8c/Csd1 [Paenibacillus spiritus]